MCRTVKLGTLGTYVSMLRKSHGSRVLRSQHLMFKGHMFPMFSDP